jgi:hypothetical protein
MLRELRAKGDVRSIEVMLVDSHARRWSRGRPSNWRARPEMDMGDNDLHEYESRSKKLGFMDKRLISSTDAA